MTEEIIKFENVVKRFGSLTVLDHLNFHVEKGEKVTIIGPSGSGKSTVLRILMTLENITEGVVWVDGEPLWHEQKNGNLAPASEAHLRRMRTKLGMVFQQFNLFPHMTVAQNIAFGLRQDRMPAAQIRERVGEMLELVRMPQLGNRKPHQLSGGQRQRVALARALARQPKLLLLDEPLGALDKRLREHTQFELVNIQERVGTTFIMVTHDQEEAMTMSSRIAVMDTGRIVQVSTPAVLYEYPATRFVAEFIGGINIFEGRVTAMDEESGQVRVHCDALDAELLARHSDPLPEGTAVSVAVRPEKIDVHEAPPERGTPATDNVVEGTVLDIAYLGDVSLYRVETAAGAIVRVQETHVERSSEPHYDWGDTLWLTWEAGSAVVLTA